jgi:hypothetical protein
MYRNLVDLENWKQLKILHYLISKKEKIFEFLIFLASEGLRHLFPNFLTFDFLSFAFQETLRKCFCFRQKRRSLEFVSENKFKQK